MIPAASAQMANTTPDQTWLGVLSSGAIGAAIGTLFAAAVAWYVLQATLRENRRLFARELWNNRKLTQEQAENERAAAARQQLVEVTVTCALNCSHAAHRIQLRSIREPDALDALQYGEATSSALIVQALAQQVDPPFAAAMRKMTDWARAMLDPEGPGSQMDRDRRQREIEAAFSAIAAGANSYLESPNYLALGEHSGQVMIDVARDSRGLRRRD
jgi:hypothetical protein